MRNDPPGMTPLRKLIAPPERTVQIVSVISNHEDVAGACPLFRPSFPPPLPPSFSLSIVSRIRSRSSLSLSFSLQEYACRSVPPNLFAREIFLRVVHRKRVLTRDPPRRITCNGTIFFGDFRSLIFLFAQTHSCCQNFNSVQIDWEYIIF